MLEAKRLSSQLSQQKVQKVLDAAQVNKERSVLSLHRQVWLQEHHRLNIARHKTEKDFQCFLHGGGFKESDTDILSQLQEYELDLEQEREEFRLTTVEPIYQLRDDLQYRLASHCSTANHISEPEKVLQQYRLASHCSTANHISEPEKVLQQVLSVKQQQEEVIDRLQCECVSLQQDICVTELKENLLSAAMEDQVAYLEKVPDEIFIADCPYPELRSDLIYSFHSLTEKYKLRLAIVETRLQGLDRNCGWNAADHECFQHIMSQYSSSLRNQRSLYIDMLQRMLPHISKQELSAHERQSDWYHFSISQKNLILQGWQRDHSELLLRALSMLEDCIISHIQQQEVQKQRLHQQNICLKLRAKLQRWCIQQEEAAELEATLAANWYKEEEERLRKEHQREKTRRTQLKKQLQRWCIQQEEAAELEATLAANWYKEEEERLRKEHQREKTRRTQLKKQINRFNADKQRKQEMQRKKDMERLAELRREIEEQVQRDKERVNFRKEQFQQKLQMREAEEKQKQKYDKEREERLQALRNQVSKVAEANPERMMGNTVAWRVRQQPEEVFTLQRPLYQLNTYTDTQIVSDPRVRIEQALRTAGLHNIPYARQILSEIQPLKPPRRDTESTAFRT
ncbi:coiled-coil domain-containing protein 148-like [Sinocyclocheilus grahami]|uniref:coiled-coil domain-containing protein 148-like n=1 Tax=Sinocyclocheilus grahami TaxID=75366 RepID=UPI0007ACE148|nr:PREDICTED: coiled-coil domain-containing protein 148-like [Sinocyclocheilus grahami]